MAPQRGRRDGTCAAARRRPGPRLREPRHAHRAQRERPRGGAGPGRCRTRRRRPSADDRGPFHGRPGMPMFIERHGGAAVTIASSRAAHPQGSPWPRVQDGLFDAGAHAEPPTGSRRARRSRRVGARLPGPGRGTVRHRAGRDAPRVRPAADTGYRTRPRHFVLTAVRGTQPLPYGTDEGRAARIVRKLTGTAINVVFAGEHNDTVVSVASAGGVGSSWPRGGLRVLELRVQPHVVLLRPGRARRSLPGPAGLTSR